MDSLAKARMVSVFQRMPWLTPVLTRLSIILSLSASVSPCLSLIRFLSRHFIAYILPVSALPKSLVAYRAPWLHLTCTVYFTEATASDDTMDGKVVHREVHVELEILPLAVPGELVAFEKLWKYFLLQLVADLFYVRLNIVVACTFLLRILLSRCTFLLVPKFRLQMSFLVAYCVPLPPVRRTTTHTPTRFRLKRILGTSHNGRTGERACRSHY